jgi:hypothetical protein
MNYHRLFGLAICGLLMAAVPVVAHHAVQAQYDFDKPIEFQGPVVKMEFVNPHSMLYLEVTNADGSKTVWKFQSGAIGTLRNLGLLKSSAEGGLKPGQIVTATGFAARNGNPMGFLKTLKMPDGRVITTWFGDPNGN